MTVRRPAAEPGGLARHLRGRVILPGGRDWDTARQPWNRRVDRRPTVVEPEDPDDMAATVAFAARSGLSSKSAAMRSMAARTRARSTATTARSGQSADGRRLTAGQLSASRCASQSAHCRSQLTSSDSLPAMWSRPPALRQAQPRRRRRADGRQRPRRRGR